MGSVVVLAKGHFCVVTCVHAGGWLSHIENRLKNTKLELNQPPKEARKRSGFLFWLLNKGVPKARTEPKPNNGPLFGQFLW